MQNMFNLVNDCKVTSHFSDDELGKKFSSHMLVNTVNYVTGYVVAIQFLKPRCVK